MTAFLWRAPIGNLKRVKSSLSARPAQAVSIALRATPVRLPSVARDKISIESTRIGMCKTGWLKGKAVGRAGAKEHKRPLARPRQSWVETVENASDLFFWGRGTFTLLRH
jgi:hypothetical protein